VTADIFEPNSNFTEGVYVDYKWFDEKNIEPRFPFGFGLSYVSSFLFLFLFLSLFL
jgi:beta-glucosidase